MFLKPLPALQKNGCRSIKLTKKGDAGRRTNSVYNEVFYLLWAEFPKYELCIKIMNGW